MVGPITVNGDANCESSPDPLPALDGEGLESGPDS